MTRHAARQLITDNARRTLVVRFIKRTTGQPRRMVCIFYPEEAAHTTFRFNPVEKGLIEVWDCEKGARRFINLDGVQEIKVCSAGGKRLEAQPARLNDDLPQTLEEADAEMAYLFGY